MSHQDWPSLFADKVFDYVKPKKLYVLRIFETNIRYKYSFDKKKIDEEEIKYRNLVLERYGHLLQCQDLTTLRIRCNICGFNKHIERFEMSLDLLKPS